MKTPGPIEFDTNDPSLPPACVEARDSLQNVLDGDHRPEPQSVRLHRETCPDCQAFAVAGQQMLVGMRRLPTAVPSPSFADRVVAQLFAHPVRPWFKRRLPWAGFALAASVLIAVLMIRGDGQTVREGRKAVATIAPPTPKIEPLPVEERPQPLRESLQQAGSAVSALTRAATADGFGLKLPNWPMPKPHVDPHEKVEPAFASLQDVRHNAAMSIAPITDSAKRAFDVFWRELDPDLETKPANR